MAKYLYNIKRIIIVGITKKILLSAFVSYQCDDHRYILRYIERFIELYFLSFILYDD